jgi:ubiquinone/menaquinone biosynthesis C-methylase UbiE
VVSILDKLAQRRYRRFSDDEWRQVLLDSAEGKAKVPMPGFPDTTLQATFVGSSGTNAILEAWNFYALMRDRLERYGRPLTAGSEILDFGCGWGRFARMFLRDVPASNIWCVDSWDLALRTCVETGVPGRKVKIDQMPPSPLPDQRFDLVFAYSVFSHLSPKAHLAWRDEFTRVMKTGALVFITTQARWFLDTCREYREHPDAQVSAWHEALARSFLDHEACATAYDRGEMLYAPNGGGPELDPEYYGEAVVPRQYFEREWESAFELLEFITDRSRFEQAVCILQRR